MRLPTLRAQQTLTRESASLIEVTLQRCEGWRKCRTSPLSDPCCLSWGFAALRGLKLGGPGRLWVSARPVRRFNALRVVILRASARPKPGIGPPCAFVPLQRRVPTAPHRSVVPATRRSTGDLPCDAASPGFPCPTTQSRTGGPAVVTADPSAAACHVRGLATPFAASTTDPPGAQGAGASMGFALQGVLLEREIHPFRGPCPPDVAGRPASRGRRSGRRPPSGPCSRDEFVLPPDSRRNPAVDAFLGFSPPEPSPHPPGLSLVVTMPALSSSGGMTSLPAWTTGLRGSDGSAGPFPDCQLSWGSAPCDRHGTPSTVPGSGLMVSPHAGRRVLDTTPTAI